MTVINTVGEMLEQITFIRELVIQLTAERDELAAQLKDWQASQNYRYIGKNGKPVLARDLEIERDALLDRVKEMETILNSKLPENNLINKN